MKYIYLFLLFTICSKASQPEHLNIDESLFYKNDGRIISTKDKAEYYTISQNSLIAFYQDGFEIILPEFEQIDSLRKKFKQSNNLRITFHDYNVFSNIRADGNVSKVNNYYHGGKEYSSSQASKYIFYENIWQGISISFYFNSKGLPEFDIIVNENGNAEDIKFEVESNLPINQINDLFVASNGIVNIEFSIPKAFSEAKEIPVKYEFVNNLLSFDTGEIKSNFTIDPIIKVWGTYYGGLGDDKIYKIKSDKNNNLYVCGYSYSTGQISLNGHQTVFGGLYDAFLSKFSPSGELLWATYYGDEEFEVGYDIATDSSGNVYLVGETDSEFNIAFNGFKNTFSGGLADGFIAKFDSTGKRLWATYYGGDMDEKFAAIECDKFGNIYAVGYTESESNIASSGYQNSIGGMSDGFLVKFNPNGGRSWGTYFGGDSNDVVYSLSIDNNSNIIIAGATRSIEGIATQNGKDKILDGDYDAYIAKFKSDGNILWATYFGGDSFDQIRDVAIDQDNNIVVTGNTFSQSNIAKNGFKNTYTGNYDSFIASFNSDGEQINGTYLGGTDNDLTSGIYLDINKNIYVAGVTKSDTAIATIDAHSFQRQGQNDAFIMIYNKDLKLKYGSYYGGIFIDEGRDVTVINDGSVYLAGYTLSETDIAENGHQDIRGGEFDGFIVKFTNSELLNDSLTINLLGNICSGQNAFATLNSNKIFEQNNRFYFELSDSSGAFKGNYIDSLDNSAVGDYQINIPSNIISSDKYKIRVVSNQPKFTGKPSNTFAILSTPIIISPNLSDTVCEGSNIMYSAKKIPNTNYVWQAINGVIVSSSNQDKVVVKWEAGKPNSLILNQSFSGGCSKELNSSIFAIEVESPELIGSDSICAGVDAVYEISDNSYTITDYAIENIYEGDIIKSLSYKSLYLNLKEVGEYTFKVNAVGKYGCLASFEQNITITENPEIVIEGSENSCLDCDEVYTVNGNFKNIKWTIDGATILPNDNTKTITVKWNTVGNKEVIVTTETDFGCLKGTNIFVNVSATPIISISPKNIIECVNNEITYSAISANGSSYTWYVENGDILGYPATNQIKVKWNKLGASKIKLVQEIPSIAFLDSIDLNIQVEPIPLPNFELQSTICLGELLLINPQFGSGNKREWKVEGAKVIETGLDDELQILCDKVGAVKITLTGINGDGKCTNSITKQIIVFDKPEKPIINYENGKLFTESNGKHYWYRDGIEMYVSDENTYETKVEGSYTVKVVNAFECESELSNEYQLEFNSLEEFNLSSIKIYPNPANEFIIINSDYPANMQIINMIGETIITQVIDIGETQIRIADLANGAYLCKFNTNYTQHIIPFIVNK